MKTIRLLIVVALAFFSLTAPARAADKKSEAALLPTSKWEIDYADTKCTLSRKFGEGAASWQVSIAPWPLGTKTILTLVPDQEINIGPWLEAQIIFDGRKIGNDAYFVRYVDPTTKRSLFVGRVDQDDFRRGLLSSSTLSVRSKKVEFSIALDHVHDAIAAIDACENDLLRGWGLSADARSAMAIAPQGDVLSFFTSDDYPSDALHDNAQGKSRIRFWVGTDGKISRCTILESSGSSSLDSKSCFVLISRARLTPAKGKDGKAMESISVAEVNWRIPN